MSENALTRRGFLAGSAGAIAATAYSYHAGFDKRALAYAASPDNPESDSRVAYCLCDGCEAKCGFNAYTKNGELTRVIGDGNHPISAGKLCARGYGYAHIAYSPNRLTEPLKKNDKGKFQAISWEQAYAEIAEKLASVIGEKGADSVALVQDADLLGSFYSNRLMEALGATKVYTPARERYHSIASGFTQVIGVSHYEPDIENAGAVMLIGCLSATASPHMVASLKNAYDQGAYIMVADPVGGNDLKLANEWLPVNPGSELALVLAMAHTIVFEGLYDKDYVSTQTVGFDAWIASLATYTPQWAEAQTGIAASTIMQAARKLARSAPAASLIFGWGGNSNHSYANTGETARAVAAFNTLLGCWNKKGGAFIAPSPTAVQPDYKKTPDSSLNDFIGTFGKLPATNTGSQERVSSFLEMLSQGSWKVVFLCHSNFAAEYPLGEKEKKAITDLDLCVAVDIVMSETAQLADYVLPDTSFIERKELPTVHRGISTFGSSGDALVEKVHSNTKPVHEIFPELAHACGAGEFFSFSVEELAEAFLTSYGMSLSSLQKAGVATLDSGSADEAAHPTWLTPTGKIQFSSEEAFSAGLSTEPAWVDCKVEPSSSSFRLIGGAQPIHTRTKTAGCLELAQISKDYHLGRVWINADTASQLNIKDDDEVELANNHATGRCRAKVTQRINPSALWLPDYYEFSSDGKTPEQGLNRFPFIPLDFEPGYESVLFQETLVTVRKVGA